MAGVARRSSDHANLGSVHAVSEFVVLQPTLEDPIIRLRLWKGSDVPALLVAFRDPHFEKFNDWAPPNADKGRAYLAAAEGDRQAGARIELAIVSAERGSVVLGGVSLHHLDRVESCASVGYWLLPDGRGRGVASRALRLLVGWAFQDLGLARLELTCGPDNQLSQNVAERCGFSREGLLRSNIAFKGQRRDSVIFSLLPGELA